MKPPHIPLWPFLAIATVIIGSLLSLDQWFPEYIIGDVTDALHFPSGVLLAVVLGGAVSASTRWRWAIWVGALALFALIEWAQPYFGRSCTLIDWVRSSAGMTLGMVLISFYRRASTIVMHCGMALCCFLALAFAFPLLQKLQTLRAHGVQFPLLFDFENERDLLLWKRYGGSAMERMLHDASAASADANGQYFARINYGASRYPAVAYIAVNQDWREFKKICFDARGDNASQLLRFKLRDERAKGQDIDLRWQFKNPAQWHTTCVPLDKLKRKSGEPFNLATVYSLQMIGSVRPDGGWFDIDTIRLER